MSQHDGSRVSARMPHELALIVAMIAWSSRFAIFEGLSEHAWSGLVSLGCKRLGTVGPLRALSPEVVPGEYRDYRTRRAWRAPGPADDCVVRALAYVMKVTRLGSAVGWDAMRMAMMTGDPASI